MFAVNIKIICALQAFLHRCLTDDRLLDLFRRSPQDFTRQRKLSFSRLVLFIAKLCKKTLSVELDHFFDQDLDLPGTCSVSALSQQRHKLKGKFFHQWNRVLCDSFCQHAADHLLRWQGYRLIAADGSGVSLISSHALYKHFGGQRNQTGHFCGAKAFFHYDVLNRLFTHSALHTYRTSEHTPAMAAINSLPDDALVIYDRYYGCYKIMALHCWSQPQQHFVIRAKEKLRFAAAFLKSGAASAEINLYPDNKAIESLRRRGFALDKNTALRVRLVRVALPQGQVEVLLTNLWEADGYGAELFGPLYQQRWGIETAIGLQKNLLQLESFSGLTVAAVEQDFYATVLMANLEALFSRQAMEEQQQQNEARQQTGEEVKVYKYPRQVNHNKASGKLRQWLVALMVAAEPEHILRELIAYFRKHWLPVRKGRKFERKRLRTQTKSKHRTFYNYKPSS